MCVCVLVVSVLVCACVGWGVTMTVTHTHTHTLSFSHPSSLPPSLPRSSAPGQYALSFVTDNCGVGEILHLLIAVEEGGYTIEGNYMGDTLEEVSGVWCV